MHQTPALLQSQSAPKLIRPEALKPFVDPLPIPPLAKKIGMQPDPANPSIALAHYRIPISQFEVKVHRDVPPTRMWGYGRSMPGPTLEVRSGDGVIVEWLNELPRRHFLPVDNRLMGAEENQPEVRTVVHLHGAKAPAESDGYPEEYPPGRSAKCYYPNRQEAALLWYHDHAMGINRLNILAGMLGLYIIRDNVEDSLNLPSGEFEIPLVLADRSIREDGQLHYPVSRRPGAPWVPEFFGNAILVNGKILPYLEVQARAYRFRVLNASNGRFYFLRIPKTQINQIGTDQGLLGSPVPINTLTLAPGERADLIIDFSLLAGEQVVLHESAVPLMQFRVGPSGPAIASSLPKVLRTIQKMAESSSVRTRNLTLEEYDNLLSEPMTHLLNGARWHDPITEKPVLNSTEIWSFLNLTDDSHPIHLHLVRFQILDRRPFDVTHYMETKQIRFTGEAVPPEPNEMGWKDTVRTSPAAITRIIAKFEGYTGRYVWHCHILEHEDNEMMRPYEVVPA